MKNISFVLLGIIKFLDMYLFFLLLLSVSLTGSPVKSLFIISYLHNIIWCTVQQLTEYINRICCNWLVQTQSCQSRL